MSSTNRGATREASDYYVTPQWAIADFLREFSADYGTVIRGYRQVEILDPCAGGDEQRGMAYPEAIKTFGQWLVGNIQTIDIRADSRAAVKSDFINDNFAGKTPDIIITNPPFSLAVEIIQKSLRVVVDSGFVIMLQRLNFFGSQDRATMFKIKPPHGFGMPIATYVHSKRMGFMPKGATNPATGKAYGQDSIEYAHFVWQKGNSPEFTKLRVL